MEEVSTHVMTEGEARKLTESIRVAALNYAEARERLLELVHEAKQGQAHEALGYKSWTAYLSDVMSEEPMRLARDERREVVQMLTDEGMSQRAIAPIVGASRDQIRYDQSNQVGENPPPAPRIPDATSTEGVTTSDAPNQKITGMDGKQYARPKAEPPKPRAEAVTKQFTSAVADLNRVLDKFHRIQGSDNFSANRGKVAEMHANDIRRAIGELEELDKTIRKEK